MADSDAELIARLRGIYRIPITDGLGAVGAGEEPDNPNEFVRHFETSPIQREAAAAIERLRSERDANGQEAFTLRNESEFHKRASANWLRLHDQQEVRADEAEARVKELEAQLAARQ